MAEAPEGSAKLAPCCRGGGPAAGLGAPGRLRGGGGLLLRAAPPAPPHQAAPALPSSRRCVRDAWIPQPRAARGPDPLGWPFLGRSLRDPFSDKLHVSGSRPAGEVSLIAQNPHTMAWRQRKEKCSHTPSIIHPPLPVFSFWALCQRAGARVGRWRWTGSGRAAGHNSISASGPALRGPRRPGPCDLQTREFQRQKVRSGVTPAGLRSARYKYCSLLHLWLTVVTSCTLRSLSPPIWKMEIILATSFLPFPLTLCGKMLLKYPWALLCEESTDHLFNTMCDLNLC